MTKKRFSRKIEKPGTKVIFKITFYIELIVGVNAPFIKTEKIHRYLYCSKCLYSSLSVQ